MDGEVAAVSRNATYSFSKPGRDEIVLVAGLGVDGDSHAGVHVRHQGRVRADPTQPNLRQVHLMHGELFDELRLAGYDVGPGQLGENVTTRGVDLLGLARGTVLRFGSGGHAPGGPDAIAGVLAAAHAATLPDAARHAVDALAEAAHRAAPTGQATVVLTGLRNPCGQINTFRPGLLKQVVGHDPDGTLVRRGGVMAVVLFGGPIRPGDPIVVEPPPGPHRALEPV